MRNITIKFTLLVAVMLLGGQTVMMETAAQKGFVKRCGWFVNPTPANAWLYDRDGEWTIGIQGGHTAEGDWPAFKPHQWVETNGHYGYGCACMDVRADRKTREVSEIKNAQPRPLSVCRKDKALKEPK